MAEKLTSLFRDVIAERAHIDDADVLARMKSSEALRTALEMYRPRNWWGVPVSPHRLVEISETDGIPLVWLPSSEILVELAVATDREARSSVLLNHESQILEDCSRLLGDCTDPWISDQATLARSVLSAYCAGHREAAMALAVSIGESLAVWASIPRVKSYYSRADRELWEHVLKKVGKYRWAKYGLEAEKFAAPHDDFMWRALAAPIPKFFARWHPESGEPAPQELSRHVVAHQPTLEHFAPPNPLIAIMLVTSLLRAQEEWSKEVRVTDGYEE